MPRRRRLSIVLSLAMLVAVCLVVAPSEAHHTILRRISVDSAARQSNDGSYGRPALSSDGRYVAFTSIASNLTSADTNAASDIFVRDMTQGTTTRVSTSSSGVQATAGSSSPDISLDGRYVVFESAASNLVAGDANSAVDIFVRDMTLATSERVSVNSSGGVGNGDSRFPAISPDGRYVAFQSDASDLVQGDGNGVTDIFVRDLQANSTARVSVTSSGLDADGPSWAPDISDQGGVVAFVSEASNLVLADVNGYADIFARKTTGSTSLISTSTEGVQGVLWSLNPSLSRDGRYVVFQSPAPNLVVGDTNMLDDVFLRDCLLSKTFRVSVSAAGTQANRHSYRPKITGDGRYIAFESDADNLIVGDSNDSTDIFIKEPLAGESQTGLIERASLSAAGVQGNGSSFLQDVSSDGRYVVFDSVASNLVINDTNSVIDVLMRDRGERVPPAVMNFVPDPPAFSPNSDGAMDETLFSGVVVDDSPPVRWDLQVQGPSPLTTTVWAFSGTGQSVSALWDGKGSQGLPVLDGEYTASLTVTDDWDNNSTATTTVRVDTAPPVIDPQGVFPRPGTNSIFASGQPLLVRIDDPSGADIERSIFVLSDREAAAGEVSVTTHPATAFIPAGGWVKTAPATLRLGRRYSVSVEIWDGAGNRTTADFGGSAERDGFLTTTFNPQDPTPGITGSCQLSNPNLTTQTQTVSCGNIKVSLPSTTTATGGSLHADFAWVNQLIPLDRIKVSGFIGGVSDPATPNVRPYPGGSVETVSARFEVYESRELQSSTVAASERRLPDFQRTVPIAWTRAELEFDVGVVADAVAVACADPSASSLGPHCMPDPAHHRFLVRFTPGTSDVPARVLDHKDRFAVEEIATYTTPFKGYRAFIPPEKIGAIASEPDVMSIERDRFEAYWTEEGTVESDLMLTPAGPISGPAHELVQRYDPYAGLVTEVVRDVEPSQQPTGPLTATDGDEGSGDCVQEQGNNREDYRAVGRSVPDVWAQAVGFFLFRSVDNTLTGSYDQYTMCAEGGLDVNGPRNPGLTTTISGGGTAYKGYSVSAGLFPVSVPEGAFEGAESFRLNAYGVERDLRPVNPPDTTTIGMQLLTPVGVVTITGSLSQYPDDFLHRGYFPPTEGSADQGGEEHTMHAYYRTASNGWWEAAPSSIPGLRGSSRFQGSVFGARWEFDPDKFANGSGRYAIWGRAAYRQFNCHNFIACRLVPP